MSQHVFYTIHNSELTSILMGWDKPLKGFFMVIDKPDLKLDEPFWSNLTHHNPSHTKTLDDFLLVLKKFNINLPQQMIAEIINDGIENKGNKEVTHSLDNGIYKRIEGAIL